MSSSYSVTIPMMTRLKVPKPLDSEGRPLQGATYDVKASMGGPAMDPAERIAHLREQFQNRIDAFGSWLAGGGDRNVAIKVWAAKGFVDFVLEPEKFGLAPTAPASPTPATPAPASRVPANPAPAPTISAARVVPEPPAQAQAPAEPEPVTEPKPHPAPAVNTWAEAKEPASSPTPHRVSAPWPTTRQAGQKRRREAPSPPAVAVPVERRRT